MQIELSYFLRCTPANAALIQRGMARDIERVKGSYTKICRPRVIAII